MVIEYRTVLIRKAARLPIPYTDISFLDHVFQLIRHHTILPGVGIRIRAKGAVSPL